MSDWLQVPKALKGNWDHLLILTFGADLPFFESALWRELATRCNNKIILADGLHYLESLESYARNSRARWVNQRYVFDGVFSPYSAHAKLILLANAENGRLLVGSGNLSMQGYASGGELFTQYEYSKEHDEALPAFHTVRQLLESILSSGAIGPTAIKHIQHLFDKTPWLYYPAISDWQPVRHNLELSFLDQLELELNGEPVEQLWVLSPFYDEGAAALKEMLLRLSPKSLTLLVQPGQTSANLASLTQVLQDSHTAWEVRSIVPLGERSDAYVHAKLYLIETAVRSICLQGSPNLSQVAMLRAGAQANIELANLLSGAREQFDAILDGLTIHPPVADFGTLDITYQQPETSPNESAPFLLTGGSWLGEELVLYFRGKIPDLQALELLVSGKNVPCSLSEIASSAIRIKIPAKVAELLEETLPVALRWGDLEDQTSNPVFACNQQALDDLLQIPVTSDTLEGAGDLDLEDEELEELLRELENQLILDERSCWQIAGRKRPTGADSSPGTIMNYGDIDFDALRRHPKLRQYRQGGENLPRPLADKTPLQILLNSIVAHFNKLVDIQTGLETIEALVNSDENATAEMEGGESEEERELEAQESQQRQRTRMGRIQQIFKNFIRRYLQGIASQSFQEIAGFDVMVKNYVIFSHVLWRLFSKEWLETDYLLDSLLEIWRVYWGDGAQSGYFNQLEAEEQKLTHTYLHEYKSDALLLATIFYCAYLQSRSVFDDRKRALRDFWRYWLEAQPMPLNAETVEGAWVYVGSLFPYEPPNPSQLVHRLRELAACETTAGMLRAIETRFCYPENSCQIKPVTVFRPFIGRSVSVYCLTIAAPNSIPDRETAIAVLQQWMNFQPLPYYRIASSDCNRLLWYDAESGEGLYLDKPAPAEEILSLPEATKEAWEAAQDQLEATAHAVSKSLQVHPQRASISIRNHK